MSIETDVKVGAGFVATGPVIGTRAELDGTTNKGPRALGSEDMARLMQGMEMPSLLVKKGSNGPGIDF